MIELYTLRQAAKMLNMSLGTLTKILWSQTNPGGLPFVKLGNKKIIRGPALDAYLKKNEVGGESLQPVDVGG